MTPMLAKNIMSMNLSGMLCILLWFSSSTAFAHPPTTDQEKIVEAHRKWTDAINGGHYDSPDALVLWAADLRGWAPGAPEDSYQREAEGLKKYLERYPRSASKRPSFEFEIVEVMLDGDLAFVHVLWTSTDAEGERQPTMRSFEIWRKQSDGSWKMSRYLESPSN